MAAHTPRPASGDSFFQFSLLLLVSTGYAAVLTTGRLDRPTAVAAGIALLARTLIILGWFHFPLSDRGVQVLTIAYIGFYPLDFLYLSGNFLAATVRLVFFLAIIKLLTAKTGRDYFYLGLIALLELLSAAMLTSSPAFLGFLALFLLFAVAARTSYEIHFTGNRAVLRAPAGRTSAKLVALSLGLTLAIAVLSVGVFFAVPRAASAYLSRLPSTGESVVGFSDEVTLGTTGRVTTSDTPVLRAKVLEGSPPPDLKWRGGALQHFDGIRWSNPTPLPQVLESPSGRYIVGRQKQRERQGPRLRYRVMRAPMDTDALFFPGTALSVAGEFSRLEVSNTDAITLSGARWKPLRYEGSSLIESHRPQELRKLSPAEQYPPVTRSLFLQLPSLDPRIAKLARYISDAQVSPYWRAAAIEHYLRTEFGYTLDLPAERAADPLAEFLFRRRKGHCEYFASAMTVMLRSIGVPARVVSGFQSGLYNPLSDSYTVRASDAHAWVEAFMPGFGWVTFDPTPAAPVAVHTGGLHQLRLVLDALDTYWNEWVVRYDVGRQLRLARSLQTRWYDSTYETALAWQRAQRWIRHTWGSLEDKSAQFLWPSVLVIAGVSAAVWIWPLATAWVAARRVARGRGKPSDCTLLYLRALDRMKRRGFIRHPWQTPQEFAATITPHDRRQRLARLTELYNCARFGNDPESARRLSGLIRSLKRPPW